MARLHCCQGSRSLWRELHLLQASKQCGTVDRLFDRLWRSPLRHLKSVDLQSSEQSQRRRSCEEAEALSRIMSLEKIMIFRVRVSTEPPKQAISLCRPNPRETGTDVRLRKKKVEKGVKAKTAVVSSTHCLHEEKENQNPS